MCDGNNRKKMRRKHMLSRENTVQTTMPLLQEIRASYQPRDAAQTTMSLLKEIFASYHPRAFAIRLWDGTVWEPEPGYPARFTLILQHPGALRKMFLPVSELSLAEAYIYNDIDIEGDIEAIFSISDYLFAQQ